MNILKAIGSFFANVWNAVVKGGDPTIVQIPANLKITPAEIDECIKAVNIVKSIVTNPVTVLVTDLTPITMDNTIRADIANALPDVLNDLTMAKTVVTDAEGGIDDVATVNAQLALVHLSSDAAKDAFYHALCARFIMIAAKGNVSWSDAVSILELYFKQIFGAPTVDAVTTAVATTVSAVTDAKTTDASPVNTAATVVAAVAPAVAAIAPAIAGDVDAVASTVQTVAAAVEEPVALPTLTPAQIAAIIKANSAPASN